MVVRWLARRFVDAGVKLFVVDGKLTDRATALIKTAAPQALELAFSSLKAPKGEKAPVYGPSGAVNLDAVLAMVPRQYRGIAALGLPFVLQRLGKGGGGGVVSEQEHPFLKP